MSIAIVASVKNWPRKSDFSTQGIFLKPFLALFHVFFRSAILKNRDFLRISDLYGWETLFPSRLSPPYRLLNTFSTSSSHLSHFVLIGFQHIFHITPSKSPYPSLQNPFPTLPHMNFERPKKIFQSASEDKGHLSNSHWIRIFLNIRAMKKMKFIIRLGSQWWKPFFIFWHVFLMN